MYNIIKCVIGRHYQLLRLWNMRDKQLNKCVWKTVRNMVIGKNGVGSLKSVPVPLCLPQIPHGIESFLLRRETGG